MHGKQTQRGILTMVMLYPINISEELFRDNLNVLWNNIVSGKESTFTYLLGIYE